MCMPWRRRRRRKSTSSPPPSPELVAVSVDLQVVGYPDDQNASQVRIAEPFMSGSVADVPDGLRGEGLLVGREELGARDQVDVMQADGVGEGEG